VLLVIECVALHQPRLPADLGFYDLRLVEVQAAQAALAAEYLIEGFCIWHYWFNGKRLLHKPVDQILASKDLPLQFCLAWANEPWSRRWLGEERDILQAQTYSEEDDRNHARWLAPVFADRRYITVDGRPLFCIYAPAALPEPQRTLDTIRRTATDEGLPEPYLVGIDAHRPGADFRPLGFDAVLNFEPQLGHLPYALTDGWSPKRLVRNLRQGVPRARVKVYSERAVRQLFDLHRPTTWTHRSVVVGWDNTPRRGRDGVVFVRTSPDSFRDALDAAISQTEARHEGDARLVWVNAWNEWAEGNYLEPDLERGHAYLSAVRAANRCD
jgi:lipopolysaccharide biosynthesis protein